MSNKNKKNNIEFKIGDIVKIGIYPQTESGRDKTPIEWMVVDESKYNNKVLIVSKYGLDCVRYNETFKNVTWEDCTLNKWLAKKFGSKAFLLSKYYLVKYENIINKTCKPTAYAIKNGAPAKSNCWWWLNGQGENARKVMVVKGDGNVSYLGSSVNFDGTCVRPAMWVDRKIIESKIRKERGIEELRDKLYLEDVGHSKMNIIKIVKDFCFCSLMDAKKIVDSAPTFIDIDDKYDDMYNVYEIKEKLENAGATVNLL